MRCSNCNWRVCNRCVDDHCCQAAGRFWFVPSGKTDEMSDDAVLSLSLELEKQEYMKDDLASRMAVAALVQNDHQEAALMKR